MRCKYFFVLFYNYFFTGNIIDSYFIYLHDFLHEPELIPILFT